VKLSGRVVAITGGSSGIGLTTALTCVEAGAAVALAGRREGPLRDAVAEIEKAGGRAAGFPADIGDEAQAAAFLNGAYERFGRLDALVNNAAVVYGGPLEGADTAQWREMVQTNVMGVLYCTHAALPLMRKSGGGHVVNVTSLGGRRALAGSGLYSATKFAVRGLSEALRQELAGEGIRVSVVVPGAVATPMYGGPITSQVANLDEIVPVPSTALANAIVYTLAQPPEVNVADIVVMPANDRRPV
jgi:NADP-dependent 3-hydroxy acid dehydrogenase YdfG